MSTLAVDASNDLFLDEAGSLIILSGLDSTLQEAEHYVKSILGEMVYQKDLGVAYFPSAFDFVNLEEFRQSVILNIERVPSVIDVPVCEVEQVGSILKYRATILTAFGVGTINA